MKWDEFMECEFYSVSVEPVAGERNVLIRILDHEKTRWLLTASGVKYFSLDEMMLQNVIESIRVYDSSAAGAQAVEVKEKILSLLQGRSPRAGDNSSLCEVVERLVGEIQDSLRVLLEIRPIYGGSVLLIAKNVDLQCESA
jgi:hypothetical protein